MCYNKISFSSNREQDRIISGFNLDHFSDLERSDLNSDEEEIEQFPEYNHIETWINYEK